MHQSCFESGRCSSNDTVCVIILGLGSGRIKLVTKKVSIFNNA